MSFHYVRLLKAERKKERLSLTLGRTAFIHAEGHLYHTPVQMVKMPTGEEEL